ncbi:GNAT family N-acetyltransferase [Rhodanobacter sp. ANJX3]|uniref:GNAT family N-acetyltransferase n=1 Tax=Rhodanobacter sp. ANJX3 TaxID=2723083 RepID=UPI00161CF9D9|nr:GNAT family N-acetyltransferase [Rhodanobacter sp. ANJX3]
MTSEPFEPLLTTRLRLRCVAPEDAAATSSLMTPGVSRWLASWPLPFTREMALARIEKIRRLAFRGHALPFAVTDKTDGRLLGWVILERNDKSRSSASLGFWLGEEHHGKGYMREIAPVVIAAGFELLALDVIEAGAQVDNLGSFAVMKACGMKPIGGRSIYAPARDRDELCHFYEVRRSGNQSLKGEHRDR